MGLGEAPPPLQIDVPPKAKRTEQSSILGSGTTITQQNAGVALRKSVCFVTRGSEFDSRLRLQAGHAAGSPGCSSMAEPRFWEPVTEVRFLPS